MSEARIIDLLKAAKGPLLSLEFFPPKDDEGVHRLRETAQQLQAIEPDFVTCTWGAGGSTRTRTLEVCEMLREIGDQPVMPHLTCVGASRSELKHIVNDIYRRGFRNIMVLRGDPPKGATSFVAHPDGLKHASDLVKLVKDQHDDICCGVAGYPEKHPEAASQEEDIQHLKAKLDAGGDFVTAQLFYDNSKYVRFFTRCRRAGIRSPIIPGILPVLSLKQALRITKMCQATFPLPLQTALERAGGEGIDVQQFGIDWATWQIDGLLENHAPCIHLYILNRSTAALAPDITNCIKRYRNRPDFHPA